MLADACCSRCGKPFVKGDRIVHDPCCLAPDCDSLMARSHFRCLPVGLQRLKDDL